MSNIDESTTHPSAMTPEQKAELDKLIEDETAGFDEADDLVESADGGASDDTKGASAAGEGKPDGEGGTASKPDGEGGEGGAAGGEGESGDGKGGTVSRQQFDGVLAELRETRNELKTVKSQIAAKPAALPDRDFDAEDRALEEELAALDKRYDEDGDLSDDEYRRQTREIQTKQRGLDRERAKYEARSELLAQQEAQAQQAEQDAAQQAQQQWDTDLGTWKESLGTWIANPARRALVDQTMAAMNADAALAALPNGEYLAKLNEFLGETFPDFPLNAGAAGAGTKSPATERQIAGAKRAAEASAAPPVINGGVGNRGTTTEDIDLENMPLGKFRSLPKEKQDELLGIPKDSR